jgi:FMN phosphatase YigB (HAD superfamily)
VIFFDLDDTLFNFKESEYQAVIAFYRDLGDSKASQAEIVSRIRGDY